LLPRSSAAATGALQTCGLPECSCTFCSWGASPSGAKTQPGILKAIQEARPNLDKPYLSEGAKDLMGKLLTRDPARAMHGTRCAR